MLEDDFELVPNTNESYPDHLNSTLHALPADWSLLWLNNCPSLAGGKGLLGAVGEGIQLCTNNYVSLGIVYTRQFALMVRRSRGVGAGAKSEGGLWEAQPSPLDRELSSRLLFAKWRGSFTHYAM